MINTGDKQLAVLGYHKIGKPYPGGWQTWYYVSEPDFVSHLEYLREHDWEVIDLQTFLRGVAEPDTLPDKGALITFDDGHKSVHDLALPILKNFDYPAILFIPTRFIGKTNSFDKLAEPEEAICDWHELKELELNGIAVQSHGVSHLTMSKLSSHEQEFELKKSKSVLEDKLQRSVDLFAFPYGDNGGELVAMDDALRRMGYRAAFLYGGGISRSPLPNRFQIERLAIGADSNLEEMMN